MSTPPSHRPRPTHKIALVAVWALVLIGAPVALSHISVVPADAQTGVETPFVVRIPNETGEAMTTARVTFPSNIRVAGPLNAPADWSVNVLGDSPESLAGADYDGNLESGGQLEVTVVGTPLTPGPAVWRVEQTLTSGRQVLWTGNPDPTATAEPAEGEIGPAAAITIAGATLDQSAPPAEAEPPEATPDEPAEGGATIESGDPESSSTAAWIAVIAAILAILALAAAGWLWSNRPMDLPEDDV